MHKQRMTYCTQPPVWTKTASEIPKLKCKAGLSTTLMKSHIKPSRESVCTGGNESEAKPAGSSASYLVPLPSFFLHYHYLACHSPRNFLLFPSLFLILPFLLAIFIALPPSLFPLSPSFVTSRAPLFPSSFSLPSGCFLLSLSVGATSGSFQFQTRPAWLGEREWDNRANPSVIPEAITLLYNPLIPLIPSHSAVSLTVRHIGILIARKELQAQCVCVHLCLYVCVCVWFPFNQWGMWPCSQTDLTQALRNFGKWINKPYPWKKRNTSRR